VCLELFATTDVVIENFKVGTMEKWGLGYADALAERFPRLIYCRITGFGPDGPLGKLPGYDAVAQAMTGLISITGMPQSGPVRMGAPIVDLGSGMNAALGIAMALYERERSGLGQLIDITLFDTGLSFLHPHSANWLEDGRLAPLSGNAHPNIAPYDLFPTRTRPIFLGIGNDRQFAIAARVLGAPHLAKDPRFASNAMRKEHTRDLTAELSALLAEWDGDELARLLLEAGVPAGPANTVAQALSDPHTRHRGMIAELDGYRGIASPIKLARSRPRTRKAPPAFAADNHDVLAEAGFDEETIAELLACGAVVAKRRTGGSD
jgi:formyl-CoA transferase